MDAILRRAQARIFEGSREMFPYPFDPFHVLGEGNAPKDVQERFRELDTGSVLDVLRDGNSPRRRSTWRTPTGPAGTMVPRRRPHH